jgi:small subunit ribosomal protein S21
MLIVEVEGKVGIEKALKVLKRKWDKSKSMKQLREKKEFKKPSVKKRDEIKRAIYIQKKYKSNDVD